MSKITSVNGEGKTTTWWKNYVVVDADGHKLSTPRVNATALTALGLLKANRKPTDEELLNLENAIWKHGPYRRRFLEILEETKEPPNPDPEFGTTVPSRKMMVLMHCWKTLYWRPSLSGMRVVNIEKNPYVPK